MDSLLFTLNAVLPIIICIVVGYVVKLLKIFPDNFWGILNKLCFRVFLPLLLFKNIYDIKDITMLGDYWQAILFSVVTILVIFIIGLGIVIILIKDDKQKGVVLQCIFRSNFAIIGIGLIELLAQGFSSSDITMAKGIGACLSAVSIPLFNILAIISLSIFVKEEGKRTEPKDVLLKIAKNPLIIAVLLGIIVLAFRTLIPLDDLGNPVFTFRYFNDYGGNDSFIYTTVKYLAQAATPVALVALGGGFTFSAVKKLRYQIILGTSIRVVAVPVLALLFAWIFKFDKIYFPAFIALFGTPVAVSSVPMSQELGGDTELAGQLVVFTTITSAFTLFIIILVSKSIGLL